MLRSRLGTWTIPFTEYITDWDWFYSPSRSLLFLLNHHGTFSSFCPHPQARRSLRKLTFTSTSSNEHLHIDAPEDLQRVTINRDNPLVFSMQNCRIPRLSQAPAHIPADTIERFLYFLRQTPEGEYIGQELQTSPSITKLVRDFHAGTMVAVSDGSFYKEFPIGSAEWILLSEDDSEFIVGGGLCPGDLSQLSAYRSELWGLLGISAAIWALEQTVGPQETSLIVGCDGETALNQCFHRNPESLNTRGKQFDLIAAVMGYWKNITATAKPQWVEGHLDDHMRKEDLPRLNQINTDRDHGAKSIARLGASSGSYRPFHIKYKFGLASLCLNNNRIVSAAEKEIVTILGRRPLQDYWLEKCEIAGIHRPLINWDSFSSATGRLPLHRHHFLLNWISRMTIVGSVARTRKIGHQYRCPRCNAWNETYSHVITCIDPKARRLRNTLLESIKAWMSRNDTYPELADILYTILYEWSRRPSAFRLPFIYTADLELRETIITQNSVGWYNMLLGMQIKGWSKVQERYYRTKPFCKKTGASWASKLQFELWGIVWDMWQHRQDVQRTTISPEDAALQLEARVAAISELRTGRDALPPFYTIYFSMTSQKLLEKSAADLRAWLRLIRGARESLDIFSNDLFSEDGPHRTWLGLRRRGAIRPRRQDFPTHSTTSDIDREMQNTGGVLL